MPTCSRPDSVLEVTSATWIESCRKTSACLCRIYVKSMKSMCRRPLTSSTRLLYVWMWSSAIQTPTPFWTSSVPLRGSFLWVLQEAYFCVLRACGLLWRTCVKKKDLLHVLRRKTFITSTTSGNLKLWWPNMMIPFISNPLSHIKTAICFH